MTSPNIVLVIADDMGYGDFGLYSEGRVRTPALDDMAGSSARFVQHYAGSPVCAPSRATLLTGRYPHRTGAITPQETLGYDRIALDEATIADSLGAAGYATGLVGKWHNGAFDTRYHPNSRGFDEFAGFRGGWMDYYRWWQDRNGAITDGNGRYLTDVLTDEAVSFIQRHSAGPFFLMVAYNAPHSPLQAPEDVVQRYQEDGHSRQVALTYAMIEVMDQGLARIRQAVRDTGAEDNTILMFTSDNGPAFRLRDDQVPEGVSVDTRRFNCGMNGAKGFTYEGGIRVPMILSWPAGTPGNRDISATVHFADWLPTPLAVSDVNHVGVKPLDGVNVRAALTDNNEIAAPGRFWQWNNYNPVRETNAAYRDGDWKLVRPVIDMKYASEEDEDLARRYVQRDIDYKYTRHDVTGIADWPEPINRRPDIPSPQLFNLADDPGEERDLANEHPDRADEMLKVLEEWFETVESERLNIASENLQPRSQPPRFA